MKTTEQYCRSITDKTLFIFCNDCNAMPTFISKSDFSVATAFANLVSAKNGFDEAWFTQHIEADKVKQVVIVGHTDCHVIPFLVKDTSENEHWMQAKHELRELEKHMGDFSSMDQDSKLIFIKYHIALQVKWVSEFLQNIIAKEIFKLRVDGIVIDETSNTVSEISPTAVLSLKQIKN